ncbi:MAG: hypothetical protein LBR17_07715 [Bacteroidales bacterium]|nr:hypothetical protein [Bacteroidales bacterium]
MNLKEKIGQVMAITLSMTGFITLLNSCSTGFYSYGYDDVYASPSERNSRQVNVIQRQEAQPYADPAYQKTTEVYVDTINTDSADMEQANDYSYNEDDYYDYAYTARIRRFHRPYLMYDYYDDYYTNLYWYTYDPWYWGTSIYLGYHWWYPSYYSYYWGYSPYWYGYYPYYGYHNHYWGHHHGGHHGHNTISYYNSHDRNSNFYRSERITIGSKSNNGRIASQSTFGERYNTRFGSTSTTRKPLITTDRGNTLSKQPLNTNTNRLQKPVQNRRLTTGGTTTVTRNNQSVNNNMRTTAPNSTISRNNRTYTPPSVRQPRTTSEFNRRQSTTRQSNTFNNRSTTTSSQRSISVPQRNNRNSSSFSTPSRSSNNSSSIRSSSSSSSSRSSGTHSSSSGSSSRGGGGRR